jgi:hypothetical protein
MMRNIEAFLLSSIAFLPVSLGCAMPGVWLRPDGSPGPQPCPGEWKTEMRIMNLHVGDHVVVDIDANQSGSKRLILYDGTIESVIWDGSFSSLTEMSRLYGQVWTTSGPHVVIRYYEAQAPKGERIPFCAVAQLDGDDARKLPDSKPGIAYLGISMAKVVLVDAFR